MNTDSLLPLIFTDLDGSLLDHYSYSFKPAEALLHQLKNLDFPVIFNTSKTRAELVVLRRTLGNQDPFIVENGAAIYIPASIKLSEIFDLPLSNGYYCKTFTQSRRHWLEKIGQLAPELQSQFQGFSTMSVNELAAATGLSAQGAELAMAREFNEPGKWTGSESEKTMFIRELEQSEAVILSGGRFLHVGGQTDKGSAMKWLVQLYRQHYPGKQIISIALGDSNNDQDMLENADMSVLIKSPVHAFPRLEKQQRVYYTENEGPGGWVEGLTHHLHQLKIL